MPFRHAPSRASAASTCPLTHLLNSPCYVLEAWPCSGHWELRPYQAIRVHTTDRVPHVLTYQGGRIPSRRCERRHGPRVYVRWAQGHGGPSEVHLKVVTLDLGGKSPNIAFEDADLGLDV